MPEPSIVAFAVEFLKAVGITGGLVAILWGALRQKPIWVPGWMYREMRAQRDDFKAVAEKALANNELLTASLDRMTRMRGSRQP